ncbi:hypothetical protein NHQ30_000436 [Ciborinia camelliae]|nr:hypothetical protein NHQ30_000436 [Ciborinia camelliae]
MDLYQLRPIHLDRPAIRLLRILKGCWSDKIQCELFSAWFDEPDSIIPYYALSYTWGSKNKVEEVIIDDTTVKITLNLHMALQHLRFEKEDLILWVDALCINQDNFQEKIHQIRQMGNIYQKAEKVVVWLGLGTRETDLVMDTMKQLHKESLSWTSAELTVRAYGWIRERNTQLVYWREGMKLVLERQWFRRIWILQEVANARTATVHCGKKFVSTRIFSQFPALIDLPSISHCQSVLDIMPGPWRDTSWWADDQKLQTLLEKFRESEATEDRDMIYALVGISSDARESDILNPRWDKSLRQVIQDAVLFMMYKKYPCMRHDASLYEFLDWTLPTFKQDIPNLTRAIFRDAVLNRQEELLKLLLATGEVDVFSSDIDGQTPFQWAVYRGEQTIAQLLLDNGADPEVKLEGSTLLLYTIEKEYIGIIRQLLDRGVSIEARNSADQTPLLFAIEKGNIGIIRLLLDRGVDIEAMNSANQTPLLFAIEKGNIDIIRLLLDNGADLEVNKDERETNPSKFQLPLSLGEVKRLRGQMPLHLAIEKGNINIIQLLLDKGIDLEGKNWKIKKSLVLAIDKEDINIIQLLLDRGADLEAGCSIDQIPLFLAIKKGNINIIQLLLDRGADFEAKNWKDETSLFLAIEKGNINIIQLLLDKGVDLEAEDSAGQTPLSLAIQRENFYNMQGFPDEELSAFIETNYTYGFWIMRHADIGVIKFLIDYSRGTRGK